MFHVLWVQEKEPRYAFSFSLKSPSKQTPCRLLNRAVIAESCSFTGPFLLTSQIPHKNCPKQRIFFLLSKALGEECPSMFPQNGAPTETDAHFQSLT